MNPVPPTTVPPTTAPPTTKQPTTAAITNAPTKAPTKEPTPSPSPAGTWSYGDYGTCSKSCGGGIATRTATCVDQGGNAVGDALCAAHAAETTTSCNVDACPTYSWQAGTWGACSVTCGDQGVQERALTCVSSLGNAVVGDENCVAGAKPSASQPCAPAPAACASNVWVPTGWSACSTSCGDGTQTRTVSCSDPSGNPAADATCTSAKPPLTQSCPTNTPCPMPNQYAWESCPWEGCSATCGPSDPAQGMQATTTRVVFCMDTVTQAAADFSKCNEATRPLTFQAGCSGLPLCTDFYWMASSWSPCQNGRKTRTFHCHDLYGGNAAGSSCAHLNRPASEASCAQTGCLFAEDPSSILPGVVNEPPTPFTDKPGTISAASSVSLSACAAVAALLFF